MGNMKNLEEMANDVKVGDLVKVFLERSDYVGYRWSSIEPSRVEDQMLLLKDQDILLCSLNPYGRTRIAGDIIEIPDGDSIKFENGPIITNKIQFVGINLKTQLLGNERVVGYQVLERTTYED